MSSEKEFFRFVEIVRALRDPKTGCPWDLEQDHSSIRPYLLEEAYEVLEAIDNKDDKEFCSELGDLLLQIVLHAQIARDRNAFSIEEVIKTVADKMVRRHPHVFADVKVDGSEQVLKNWEAIKRKERSSNSNASPSVLEGVPKNLPSLLRAARLGEKAAKVHFDWTSISDVWKKVQEEMKELSEEIQSALQSEPTLESKTRLEHELGDLLFSITQLARWLGLSAEDSLRMCCERFITRFQDMETNSKIPLSTLIPEELESAWKKAKTRLK